jgi:hypothetical protein
MVEQTIDLSEGGVSTPSEAIILEISNLESLEPTEMPALYEVLNPAALDELFRGRAPGTVAFEYAGYKVNVFGCERATIRPASGTSDATDGSNRG